MIKDQILTKEELTAAMAELKGKGLIEYEPGSNSIFNLTDAGLDYAWELMLKHTPAEIAALSILSMILAAASKEKEGAA